MAESKNLTLQAYMLVKKKTDILDEITYIDYSRDIELADVRIHHASINAAKCIINPTMITINMIIALEYHFLANRKDFSFNGKRNCSINHSIHLYPELKPGERLSLIEPRLTITVSTITSNFIEDAHFFDLHLKGTLSYWLEQLRLITVQGHKINTC